MLGLVVGSLCAGPALAQYEIVIPTLDYRTGPFAPNGIPFANGQVDYYTMLNERDGGINGVKIKTVSCETAYNTQQGVECYEKTKGTDPSGAVMYQPLSTGITYQLIPKASVDKIPIFSMGYGRTSAADGTVFPWVFNFPATYWSQATSIMQYVADQEGGFDKLQGKKIGLIYLDAGYGREPIPLFEQLAQKYGYELVKYPVPANQMQNQSSQWLNVRRDRPDYMVMWGWGAMNPTAVKEAAKIRYPMEKFIGIWWSGGEDDARPAGEGAKGYKTLNFNAVGPDFPALQDIRTNVVDKGLSKVSSPERVGENLYNRGVMNSVLIAEAIRTAQQLTGKPVVDAEDVRRGFENLDITEARLKELGLEGFMPPIKITCEDHSGGHAVYVQQWDGKTWQKASDWFAPMTDVVRPMLEQAAADYVKANQPWPERAEPCS
jgi:branched-chain amino acid transport system substrate-binding protein